MANKTVADDMRAMLGSPKRWKEGEIFFAENTFLKMAFAVTTDHAKVGTIGIINDTFVELITEEQGRLWDVECQHQS